MFLFNFLFHKNKERLLSVNIPLSQSRLLICIEIKATTIADSAIQGVLPETIFFISPQSAVKFFLFCLLETQLIPNVAAYTLF